MIEPYKRVLVLGCASCVAECAAGGQKETAMLASTLRMKAKMKGDDVVIEEHTLDRQCVNDFVVLLDDIIDSYDAVLSLGCGAGVQAVQEMYQELPVIPALDTEFIGETKSQGLWVENCLGCGDCMLYYFGGVCPLARCSKQLFNGPCGGSTDGRCEINAEVDCAWQLIIDRLKALDRLDEYEALCPLKDWSSDRAGGPRKVVREDVQQ